MKKRLVQLAIKPIFQLILGTRSITKISPAETTMSAKYSKYITINTEDSDDNIVSIPNTIWSNYQFHSIISDVFRHFFTLHQFQS